MVLALQLSCFAPGTVSRASAITLRRPSIVCCSLSRVLSKRAARGNRTAVQRLKIKAVAEAEAPTKADAVIVSVDNKASEKYTVIKIGAPSKPGMLSTLTATFRDLGLDVIKAEIDGTAARISDTFYVCELEGGKVTDELNLKNIKTSLESILRAQTSPKSAAKVRPKLLMTGMAAPLQDDKKEMLYSLMGMLKAQYWFRCSDALAPSARDSWLAQILTSRTTCSALKKAS